MFASLVPTSFQSRARATGACCLARRERAIPRATATVPANAQTAKPQRMPLRTINGHDSCLRFILTLKYFKFALGETTIFARYTRLFLRAYLSRASGERLASQISDSLLYTHCRFGPRQTPLAGPSISDPSTSDGSCGNSSSPSCVVVET